MNTFYYVYVLRSSKDANFYVGFCNDLKRRLDQHNAGQVQSTAHRRPLELVYYEACRSQKDATIRERYLKTAWGKRYIKGDSTIISRGVCEALRRHSEKQ